MEDKTFKFHRIKYTYSVLHLDTMLNGNFSKHICTLSLTTTLQAWVGSIFSNIYTLNNKLGHQCLSDNIIRITEKKKIFKMTTIHEQQSHHFVVITMIDKYL